MAIETKSMQMTPADGNVFSDLGFTPEEAAKLKADSQRLVSLKRALQDHLVTELGAWIEANDLMPADTAKILGITRQRASDIIDKKGMEFSIDSLANKRRPPGSAGEAVEV